MTGATQADETRRCSVKSGAVFARHGPTQDVERQVTAGLVQPAVKGSAAAMMASAGMAARSGGAGHGDDNGGFAGVITAG
jgi:hypothetical protein